MEGFPLFVITISLWRKWRKDAQQYRQDAIHLSATSEVDALLEIKQSFIRRSESEFSLGLNRSTSIDVHLSEFGELCQSGKAVVWSLTGSAILCSLVGSFLLFSKK
jgi:hypothetical protein